MALSSDGMHVAITRARSPWPTRVPHLGGAVDVWRFISTTDMRRSQVSDIGSAQGSIRTASSSSMQGLPSRISSTASYSSLGTASAPAASSASRISSTTANGTYTSTQNSISGVSAGTRVSVNGSSSVPHLMGAPSSSTMDTTHAVFGNESGSAGRAAAHANPCITSASSRSADRVTHGPADRVTHGSANAVDGSMHAAGAPGPASHDDRASGIHSQSGRSTPTGIAAQAGSSSHTGSSTQAGSSSHPGSSTRHSHNRPRQGPRPAWQ